MAPKRVLIISYSFTQQTSTQLRHFIAGLEDAGIEVSREPLVPHAPYPYPFPTLLRLVTAMLVTSVQKRMPIAPLSERCSGSWDCIVLAGPTWSYNPSGPILSFLDRDAERICRGQRVIPFISCRAYWQWNAWIIKRRLIRCGAVVEPPIVFTHPFGEPWRSLGLLLKLRGTIGRRHNAWIRTHYPRYGHSDQQRIEARHQGEQLAARLLGTASS